MRADLKQALNDEGFTRRSRGVFVRGPNAGDIEHVIMLESLAGSRIGQFSVGVGVRHNRVERCLGRFFVRIDMPGHAQLFLTEGGYAMGLQLGMHPVAELAWETPVAWFGGTQLSLAQADRRMQAATTLDDLERLCAVQGDHRQTWTLSGDVQLALRLLIMREMLAAQGTPPFSRASGDELAASFRNLAARGYRDLEAFSFDEIRAIVREVVREEVAT